MLHHPLFRRLAASAFAVALFAHPASAADAKAHTLSEWKLGKVLFGEKVSKDDTKGKVVVIEYWGTHCPPCIASLPHLAELEKKNRDKGLVVIGGECQGSSKDEIKPLITKAKVEYTITEGVNGPIPVSGIPRAFVFDRDGKLVFDGYPLNPNFTSAVQKALGDGPAPAASASKLPSNAPLIAARAWTNAEGKEIHAAVKTADATTVTFLMPNGQTTKYQMDKLSEASRKDIQAAVQ